MASIENAVLSSPLTETMMSSKDMAGNFLLQIATFLNLRRKLSLNQTENIFLSSPGVLHQAIELLSLDLSSFTDRIFVAQFVVGRGGVQLEIFVEFRKVNFINNFLIVCCVPKCVFSVIRLQYIQLQCGQTNVWFDDRFDCLTSRVRH